MVSALRFVMLPRRPIVVELIRSYTSGKLLDSSTTDGYLVEVQMLVDNVQACYAVSGSNAYNTYYERHPYDLSSPCMTLRCCGMQALRMTRLQDGSL